MRRFAIALPALLALATGYAGVAENEQLAAIEEHVRGELNAGGLEALIDEIDFESFVATAAGDGEHSEQRRQVAEVLAAGMKGALETMSHEIEGEQFVLVDRAFNDGQPRIVATYFIAERANFVTFSLWPLGDRLIFMDVGNLLAGETTMSRLIGLLGALDRYRADPEQLRLVTTFAQKMVARDGKGVVAAFQSMPEAMQSDPFLARTLVTVLFALNDYEAIRTIDPKLLEGASQLAFPFHLASGEFAEAKRGLAGIRKRLGNHYTTDVLAAQLALAQGRTKRGLRLLRDLLAEHPDLRTPYTMLIDYFMRQRQPADAMLAMRAYYSAFGLWFSAATLAGKPGYAELEQLDEYRQWRSVLDGDD